MDYLNEKGISCGIHYPIPLHLQKAYKALGYNKGSFPVAENIAEKQLSLPVYAELTEEQIRGVCEEIKNYFAEN